MRKIFLILTMCFALLGSTNAQQTVTGTVTGEDGIGIPGVSVVQKGTNAGTITNIDGVYTISVPSDATLVFSFVGMQTTEEVVEGRATIDVLLRTSQIGLEEVVVTALGISREKKALGYSVSEVRADDISTVKDHNPINSLAGKVAGVVISQANGSPGAGARVVIRGNNSLNANNQPLIVVDGVPLDDTGVNSGASVYNTTVRGGGITDINPDDIESMSVLKGPNAAALYGSRASNGVILVTTKKGTKGKGLGVSFNSSYTSDSPFILPDYQNEYGQGSQGNVQGNLTDLKNSNGSWGSKLDGSNKLYYTDEQRPYVAQPDNVSEFFRNGSKFINTLAIAGGGANYSMRVSYTNNSTQSILENSDLDSHNFNVRGTVDLTDKFTIDSKVTYFTQTLNNTANQGSEGILAYVLYMPRNIALEDYKIYQKPEVSLNSIGFGSLNANPYWMLYQDYNWEKREKILGFVKANYKFTDWLSAFARVGTDVTMRKTESVNMPGHHFYGSGRLSFGNDRASETIAEFLFTANKDLNEDFSLTVNAGASHSYRTYEAMSISGENFKIPTRPTIANLVTVNTPGYTPLREHKINSVMGTASLSYQNFIYLDVTGRNDWSSTLPAENRSYFYPSASLSVLLDQLVDPEGDTFNLLKLRGGWSKVGGDTDPYQLYPYYTLAGDGYLGQTQLGRPSVKFPEDSLKPEATISTEFGVEAAAFDNRLFFDFTYYNIKSSDLIYDVPVPASTGYSTERTNIGEISNKGFEFLLGGTPVRANGFDWNVSMNFTKNNNELVNMTEDLERHQFNETNSGAIVVQATVGGGYGEIYGKTFKTTEDGRLLLRADGSPQASDERVLLGNAQPDWLAGLTNKFTYKNLSLSFLIDVRWGGQVYNSVSSGLMSAGVTPETLEYRDGGIVVNGVIAQADGTYKQNDVKITAQEYWGSIAGIASEHIQDMSNIRLREMVLAYQLPQSVIGSSFIKDVKIGLTGRNILMLYSKIDHVDPELSLGTGNNGMGIISNNLPTTRSLGVNLNIKF